MAKIFNLLNKHIFKYRLNFFFVSGFAIAGIVPYLNSFLGLVSIVAFVGIYYYVDKIHGARNLFKNFFLGGLLWNGLAFSFILQARPSSWSLDITGHISVIAVIFAWLWVVLPLGLCVGGIGKLIEKTKQKYRLSVLIICLIIFEISKPLLFSIITYGNGGEIGFTYIFGSIAPSVAFSDLVYVSRSVGFYGLTIIIFLLNYSFYNLIFNRFYRLVGISFIFSIFIFSQSQKISSHNTKKETLNISAVHLARNDTIDKVLYPGSIGDNQKIIVTPEHSGLENLNNLTDIARPLNNESAFIYSKHAKLDSKKINLLVVLDKNGRILTSAPKDKLVAGGEYLPLSIKLFMILLGQSTTVINFENNLVLSRGSPIEPINIAGSTLGIHVCSGIFTVNAYEDSAEKGSDVLINIASLSYFTDHSLLDRFSLNMAKYHAIRNNVAFIQSSRGGKSFVMDSNGNIIIKNNDQSSQLIEATIKI